MRSGWASTRDAGRGGAAGAPTEGMNEMSDDHDAWDDEDAGEMDAGVVIAAGAVEVPLASVPAKQVVSGAPQTGSIDLDEDMGLGVWEMTPGAMRDTEVSEVFVVIAGSATVEFVQPALPPIELAPGAIVRLESGMQTVWTVRETLRKVYLA